MVRPQRAVGSYKRPKKIEIIPPLHCYLSDPIANNQITVRRSIINKILWIDSRTCWKSPLVNAGKA